MAKRASGRAKACPGAHEQAERTAPNKGLHLTRLSCARETGYLHGRYPVTEEVAPQPCAGDTPIKRRGTSISELPKVEP